MSSHKKIEHSEDLALKAEAAGVKEELKKINFVLDQSCIVSKTDQRGNIIDCNKKFEAISGYKKEEIIGENHRIVNSSHHSDGFYETLWNRISSGKVWEGEIKNKAKNGTFYWVDSVIVPVVHNGEPYEYYSIQRDISEQKRAEEEAIQLSYFDSVTGLSNRPSFEKDLSKKLTNASSNDHIALLLLDMDRFKYMNDTLGHKIGDQILQQVAQRLEGCLPDYDTQIARVGGDEFAILVLGIQGYTEVYKISNIVKAGFSYPFVVDDHQVYLTSSIGVSVFPEDGGDPTTLFKASHNALHYAKRNGKNRVQFYKSEMNVSSERLFTLENDLYKAYEEESFSLSFQPRVDVKTGKIVGAEALIRWELMDGKPVSPSEFIPLAEEIGLIIPIGNWTIKKACEQNKKWQDLGLLHVPISVNLSTQHLKQKNLASMIQKMLEETNLSPEYLEIEITENIFAENTDLILEVLADLKKLGIKVALDDFGTGYCSLSYLKKFEIDIVKIDQTFVHNLPDHPVDTAIVNSVLELAKILRKRVVAEGVENQEQLMYLYERGCDEIQGFLYSKPLTIDQFEKMLSEEAGTTMFTGINLDTVDRRKYFRVNLFENEYTTLTILSFDDCEKQIDEIRIHPSNLSSGGLQFHTNSVLPTNPEKFYKIKGCWNGQEEEFIGSIVWGKEALDHSNEYGMKFYLTEDQRKNLNSYLYN